MELQLAPQEVIDEVAEILKPLLNNLEQKAYSLVTIDGRPGIMCHQCGQSSTNSNDVKHRYCGNCHRFLEDAPVPRGIGEAG
ncbi:hypothetical protein [Methylomonas sp. MgM2]